MASRYHETSTGPDTHGLKRLKVAESDADDSDETGSWLDDESVCSLEIDANNVQAMITDPARNGSWAEGIVDSEAEYDSNASDTDSDEDDEDIFSRKPDMETDEESVDGADEFDEGGLGYLVRHPTGPSEKEVIQAMIQSDSSTYQRWKGYKKLKHGMNRIRLDHIGDRGDPDRQMFNIVRWEHGGYYDLVMDESGDFERLGAGIYREPKVGLIYKRRGRNRIDEDGNVVIPAKALVSIKEQIKALEHLERRKREVLLEMEAGK